MTSRYQSTRSEFSEMGRMAKESEVQMAKEKQLIQEAREMRSERLERKRLQEDQDGYSSSTDEYGQGTGDSRTDSRYSSRQSSIGPSSILTSSSRSKDPRALCLQLNALEERFKSAMVTNAQMDNDRQLLRYEVTLLQDKLEDITDAQSMLQKSCVERKKELSYKRMQIAELTHQLELARQQIEARDQLLNEKGYVLLGAAVSSTLVPNDPHVDGGASSSNTRTQASSHKDYRLANGDAEALPSGDASSSRKQSSGSTLASNGMALVSKETADLLTQLPGHDMGSRLTHLFQERSSLQQKVDRLQSQLEVERKRADMAEQIDARSRNHGADSDDLRQTMHTARAQLQDYKIQYQQSLLKVASLERDVLRLEGQVKRYKTIADVCEKQEDELKDSRRRLTRELRETQIAMEDLKGDNKRLKNKLDKLTRCSQQR